MAKTKVYTAIYSTSMATGDCAVYVASSKKALYKKIVADFQDMWRDEDPDVFLIEPTKEAITSYMHNNLNIVIVFDESMLIE